jgi:SH3 domain protein
VKSTLNFTIIILILSTLICGTALGETVYVKGIMRITMRTGPGVEHKIVAMLESGDRLEIMESDEGWSHVRNVDGKEGWVLTRYVTSETPNTLIADRLKSENSVLSEAIEKLKAENAELAGIQARFETLDQSYSLLKKESADFLILKQKYEKVTKAYQELEAHSAVLEKSLGNEDVKWFLSGAGVLVAGILLGMSARKKKRNSLL